MKRLYTYILQLILIGITNYSFADYPIVGYKYLADPGALVYNGRVYVYCSNDDENADDGYKMSSIVCVSSSDLKNWTDHGVVFDVPRDASWSGLSWAPSPSYRNGKFYLYFGNGGSAIGVAVSDSPVGPFVDPVGRAIVNGSTPGVQPSTNMWLFDPMTFIDDDGQAYMYFGGNGDDNLRVIRLNTDMVSVQGSAGRFNVPNFFEAAWMHKHNGVYYFTYSSNPSAGMRIDYMTSTNPMSGFTYRGVVSPQPPNNNNNNHHAIIQLGGQWYQIYHNRIVAAQNGDGTTYHRNLAIDRFSYRQDGTIVQMVNTVNGVQQLGYMNPYLRLEAETMSDHKGIETEVCSEGGMNLAYIDNSDWTMVEGVDFGSSGAGNFSARVASDKAGGSIEVRLGSPTGTLIGTLAVPNTGGFQNWQTSTTTVNRTTGVHNVYFVFKGSASSLFNINHWSFSSGGPTISFTSPTEGAVFEGGSTLNLAATATSSSGSISNVQFYNGTTLLGSDNSAPYSYSWTNVPAGTYTLRAVATENTGRTSETTLTIKVNPKQGPYNGTIHLIPGTVQLESYDIGGNGFAYLDNTPGSAVTPIVNFRTNEDVDIENCTDTGGGYNIGYATAGEWLEYTVNVQTTGIYHLDLRVACEGDDRTLSVSMDGTTIAANVAIPNTAGWQTWQTVRLNNISLTAGQKIMRVTIGAIDYINLNYASFTLASPPVATITSAGPTTFCTGGSVVLNAGTGTGYTYQWKRDGNNILNATASSYTASQSGSYTVTVSANSQTANSTAVNLVVNALPNAPGVTTPVMYCQNTSTTPLIADGTNLKWYSVASGGTSSATAPIPSTSAAGTTNYYVSQEASGCESARATIAVSVNALPVITPYVQLNGGTWLQQNTAQLCEGSSLVLGPQPVSATGWSWAGPSGFTSDSREVLFTTLSSAQGGAYTVTYTSNGCTSTQTYNITVNNLPDAPMVSSPVSYCQNASSMQLTASDSNLKWYTVSSGGTSSSTAPTPSTATTGATNHYVSQTENGCESSRATITVTVNAIPGVPSVTSPVRYCQNATALQLSATGKGLKWYTVSSEGTSSVAAPTPSSATAGTINHYVSQTVNGCESSRAMISVTINALPDAEITASGPTTFVQGGSVTLIANTGSGLSYIWFNGTMQVGTAAFYTATSTGSYTVEVSNASGCKATSPATNVSANGNQPSVISIVSPTSNSTVNGPITITVNVSDPDGGITKVEYLDGTTVIGTSTSSPYSFTLDNPTAGDHVITVRVTDSNGGVTTSSPVTVTSGSTTSIQGTTEIQGLVYPNPASGEMTIETAMDLSNARVTVINVLGEEIHLPSTMNGRGASIDVSNLTEGTYMLIIKKGNSLLRKKISVIQ